MRAIQLNELIKNTSDLGHFVVQLRKNEGSNGKKMSAQALADLAGVSRDTIVRIERGDDVSFSTALRVLRVFSLGLNAAPVPWPNLATAKQHFKVP